MLLLRLSTGPGQGEYASQDDRKPGSSDDTERRSPGPSSHRPARLDHHASVAAKPRNQTMTRALRREGQEHPPASTTMREDGSSHVHSGRRPQRPPPTSTSQRRASTRQASCEETRPSHRDGRIGPHRQAEGGGPTARGPESRGRAPHARQRGGPRDRAAGASEGTHRAGRRTDLVAGYCRPGDLPYQDPASALHPSETTGDPAEGHSRRSRTRLRCSQIARHGVNHTPPPSNRARHHVQHPRRHRPSTNQRGRSRVSHIKEDSGRSLGHRGVAGNDVLEPRGGMTSPPCPPASVPRCASGAACRSVAQSLSQRVSPPPMPCLTNRGPPNSKIFKVPRASSCRSHRRGQCAQPTRRRWA